MHHISSEFISSESSKNDMATRRNEERNRTRIIPKHITACSTRSCIVSCSFSSKNNHNYNFTRLLVLLASGRISPHIHITLLSNRLLLFFASIPHARVHFPHAGTSHTKLPRATRDRLCLNHGNNNNTHVQMAAFQQFREIQTISHVCAHHSECVKCCNVPCSIMRPRPDKRQKCTGLSTMSICIA